MQLKKFILPLAMFAALTIAGCDDEKTESGCESTEDDTVESCDLSVAEVCSDEETEDVYYTYNGKRYDNENDLIDAICPSASSVARKQVRENLSIHAKSLMARIRMSAI